MDMDSMTVSAANSTTTASSSSSVMAMGLFHTGIADSLFWSSWKPQSSVAYAFTFLFLAALGIASRALLAYMAIRERQMRVKNVAGANIIVQSTSEHSEKTRDADADSTSLVQGSGSDTISTLSVPLVSNGDEAFRLINPWRMSVDIPRGLLQLVSSGIGYLLMLAVMTGNIGYLFAVLVGVLIGEVVFGRFGFAPVASRRKVGT